MQFLHQAAHLLAEQASIENKPIDLITTRHYASEAKNMAKRHVLRTDPALKQLYCKRCNCILPKSEGRLKLRGKNKKQRRGRILDCPFCAYANHIPAKFWTPNLVIVDANAAEETEG